MTASDVFRWAGALLAVLVALGLLYVAAHAALGGAWPFVPIFAGLALGILRYGRGA